MHEELAQDQVFVTVDNLILTVRDGRLKLLLARRNHPPFEGRWALPGRLVALKDSAEETARRLLEEMLPVTGAFLEQLYTFAELDRDPRGRVISIAYLAAVPWEKLEAALAREDARMRGFDVRLDAQGLRLDGGDGLELTGGDLAFDHGRIVETGVRRLRGKIDYTDVAFHFLNDPGAFSLSELQAVFEAVLDRSIDGSNFRRMIQSRYEETGVIERLERDGQAEAGSRRRRGRPAAMYRMVEPEQGG